MTDRIIDHIGLHDRAPMSAVEQAREGWDLEWQGGPNEGLPIGAEVAILGIEHQALMYFDEDGGYTSTIEGHKYPIDIYLGGTRIWASAPTITACAAALKARVREMLKEALAALD
jgi:hypothetical protein